MQIDFYSFRNVVLLIIPIGYWHTSQVCSSQLFVTFFYVLGSIDKAYNYFQQPTYKNVTYDLYYNLKSNTKNWFVNFSAQ